MDFPGSQVTPLYINTWSSYGPAVEFRSIDGGGYTAASMTWPLANMASYMPVRIPWPYPVKRVFWVNASSVTTTNFDFGIYNADGTKIYSTGSTAAAGASASQYVTPTEFTLYPGAYYFALSCSSITANRGGLGTVTAAATGIPALVGFLQEASALPLPTTMTPVTVANFAYPVCGVTRTLTGG